MRGVGPRDGEPADGKRPGSRLGVASLVLAVALLAAGGALALVALRGPAQPSSMDDRVRAVAVSLRCPVCQNLSVGDSPSRLAQEMRRTIAGDLRAGKSPEEIRAGFVRAYGPWILESPPKRGIDLVAWIAPALLLMGGLVAGGLAIRRWSGPALAGPTSPADAEPGPLLTSADRSLLERALAKASEQTE
jgi:cytochrome c-type biogenesis protein CcmH